MNTTRVIMRELSTYPSEVLSWGFSQFIYDEGADLFNIIFLSNEDVTVCERKGICLDDLVKTIDEYVEKTDDYDERIREQYNVVVLNQVK